AHESPSCAFRQRIPCNWMPLDTSRKLARGGLVRSDTVVVARPLKPFGELEGQEFAKKGADSDARIIIAAGTDVVSFLFIKSIIWTVKGQLHEPGERYGAPVTYLFFDNFGQFCQLLAEWCGFSY